MVGEELKVTKNRLTFGEEDGRPDEEGTGGE